MITLGLRNIIRKLRGPLPNELQTLSEMIERLEPSPVVSQALTETVAWCLTRSLQHDHLRSSELDPSTLLGAPSFDDSVLRIWLERKSEGCERAVNAINANRSSLIRDRNINVAGSAVAESKGKLLLYEPMETVIDGASDASSRGFFDIDDAPPWDTWFLYAEGSIVSWVPEAMIRNAQAGIDANPVDCIHWCDWSKLQEP